MRFDGTLKTWNDERGFGFIEPRGGGQDIFVHISALPPGTGRPAPGLALSFEVETGPNGKKRARAVAFPRPRAAARAQPRAEAPAPWTMPRRLAIPAFVAVYAGVASAWGVAPVVALAYLLASALAFVAYALDKSAARHGRWRTPEKTLHLLGLAGGWPGALLAQQWLRHKCAKAEFVAVFWATVGLNVAGFVVLHAPAAAALRG